MGSPLICFGFLAALLYVASVDGQTPTEVSLVISETCPDTIYIGGKCQFTATASFPSGVTNAVIIELLPSVEDLVFAMGDVISCTVGGNLDQSLTSACNDKVSNRAAGYEDTTLGVAYDDHVIYNFGNVDNSGSSSDTSESTIVIVAEAVYVNRPTSIPEGSTIWISVGMDYSDGQFIQISMTSKTIQGLGTTSAVPSVSLTDPGSIPTNDHLVVPLTIYLPYPSSAVTVYMTNLYNDEIFLQSASVTTVGSAFAYSVYKDNIKAITYDACSYKFELELPIGTLINKESLETGVAQSDQEIGLDLTFQQMNETYDKVGVAVAVDINGQEIFLYDGNWTVTQGTQPAFTTFTIEALNNVTEIPGLSLGHAKVTLTIPPKSNINYSMGMSVAGSGYVGIVSVTPFTYGANMPCEIPIEAPVLDLTESATVSGLHDSGTYSFNRSNFGFFSDNAEQNEMTLIISLLAVAGTTESETYTLSVDINSVGAQTVDFTIGPDKPLDTDVNYVFTTGLVHTATQYTTGTTVPISMHITTERNKIPGPMTIEYPIPADLANSYLQAVGLRVVKKGKNVLCAPSGNITNLEWSKWNDTSSENDRAIATLFMCNLMLIDSTNEDELEFELLVKIKDLPALLSETVNQAAGIGVKFSETQIFVADVCFDSIIPTFTDAPISITELTITSDIADDILFQYSTDGLEYFDNPYAYVSEADPTKREFARPILTRYYRVINTNGGLPLTYTVVSTAVTQMNIFGSNESDKVIISKLMRALDNDTDTCFSLPLRGASDTAPYLWAEIKTDLILFADALAETFVVRVTGEGISCGSHLGPQITRMMYPVTGAQDFIGQGKFCTFVETSLGGDKMQCDFTCPCTSTAECDEFTLLMFHNTTADPYTLCEIEPVSPLV